MDLKKEDTQHYWVDSDSDYKAKIYIAEDSDDVLAKVRWEDNDMQHQMIIPIYPITTCMEMAQRAINIVQDKQKAIRRAKIKNA